MCDCLLWMWTTRVGTKSKSWTIADDNDSITIVQFCDTSSPRWEVSKYFVTVLFFRYLYKKNKSSIPYFFKTGLLLYFSCFANPKCWCLMSWDWDLTIKYLSSVSANGSDGTIKCNSLWIISIWRKVQLALHKFGRKTCSSERDTFYFYTEFFTFQCLCFLTFTQVKMMNLNLKYWFSIWTSTCVKNVCTFWNLCLIDCKTITARSHEVMTLVSQTVRGVWHNTVYHWIDSLSF